VLRNASYIDFLVPCRTSSSYNSEK